MIICSIWQAAALWNAFEAYQTFYFDRYKSVSFKINHVSHIPKLVTPS